MSQHGLCCVECHANGTAQGEYAGAMVERERIIALLKAVDDELGIFAVGWTMQEIAELIKGENE